MEVIFYKGVGHEIVSTSKHIPMWINVRCGMVILFQVGHANIGEPPVTCFVCLAAPFQCLAFIGDRFSFDDKILVVINVDGCGPDDFVFFEDGTNCKQKNLNKVLRIP